MLRERECVEVYRCILVLTTLTTLAACGDPLRDTPRLADLDVDDSALETPAVIEPEAEQVSGFFSRILNRDTAPDDVPSTEAVDASLNVALGIEPAENFEITPSEGTLAADAGNQSQETIEEPPARRGLFARLLSRDAPEVEPTLASATAPEAAPFATEIPASADAVAELAPTEPVEAAAPAAETLPARRGFFGRLLNPETTSAATPLTPATTADAPPQDEVVQASVAEMPAEPATARRGLFGRRNAERTGPDARIVEPGTVLPFGEIATVCGLGRSALGNSVGRFPDNRSGYKLYDTIPNASANRTYYLTGFEDGCARQFTANIVTPGDLVTHEFLRYEALSSAPYSTTDQAYEKVKNSICRSSTGKPCGGRMSRLEANTMFFTLYERFGTNADWVEVLVHDGRVLAIDRKSR